MFKELAVMTLYDIINVLDTLKQGERPCLEIN